MYFPILLVRFMIISSFVNNFFTSICINVNVLYFFWFSQFLLIFYLILFQYKYISYFKVFFIDAIYVIFIFMFL
jgi:hypothetical protein